MGDLTMKRRKTRPCFYWRTAVLLALAGAGLPAARPLYAEVSAQRLKSLSLQQLGQVEVTTVSKEPEEVWQTPAAVFVLTQDDIRRSGATTIPELLRLVPGVDVARSQSGTWSVGIRGFASVFSKGLLVLIDGRSVYTPLFEGVFWDVQDLPLRDIDRIEVIRGPGGTIWGPNAVNGVINIITKKAADTQGAMAHFTGGGAVDRFTGAVGYGLSPRANLQLRLFAKGFNRGPERNPGGDPYDRWHQVRGGFRADWQPGPDDSVSTSFMAYAGETGGQNTFGEFFPPSQRVVDGPQIVSGGDVVVRWDHQLARGSSFYLQGYFDRTNRVKPQGAETRDTVDLDFIDHIANLPRQDLILGAGLRESPSYLEQTQATLNFVPHRINNYVYSLFAQDAFQLVPERLTLTLGSKLIDDVYSGWGAQPTAQILWRPAATTALWASIARALRTPGRVDHDMILIDNIARSGPRGPIFFKLEGNPKFAPEVLIGSSAGFRQMLWKKLYMDLAVFHSQYDNLESYGGPVPPLTFPTQPYPYEQINVQFANGLRGVSDGIEVAPDWQPLSWLELRGSFSHVHLSLHSKPGFSQASYAAGITGASPHRMASAQAILMLPGGWEIVPDYRFVSALPAQRVPSYQTADARVAYRIADRLELSATGRNLLQPEHRETAGDDNNAVGIKREVFGGLSWSW